MSNEKRTSTRSWSRTTWVIIAVALLVFVGANAHLLYVALNSQSECVPHLKERAAEAGQFRAAKSGC